MSGTSNGGEDGSWNWESKRDLNSALGSQTCLDDNIQGVSGPFCGDGIVQGDEECDPGVGFADACCTSSCALASGCVCPITDPCCNDDGSGFQSQGTLCRAATHPTCDVPEFCSGSSSVCPQDGAADAGVSCTSWPVGGKCYNGGCHAPLGCSWSDFQYFWEAKRNTCLEQCTSVDRLANPFSGYSYQTMSYGPDGTPCGDGRQCVSAGPGDAGVESLEFCVTSASLNVGNPTPPPTPTPTPAPAPTGPPTRLATASRDTATTVYGTTGQLARSPSPLGTKLVPPAAPSTPARSSTAAARPTRPACTSAFFTAGRTAGTSGPPSAPRGRSPRTQGTPLAPLAPATDKRAT